MTGMKDESAKDRKTYREVLEGTSLLDVSKGSLQVLEFFVNLFLSLLGVGNLTEKSACAYGHPAQ